MSDIKFDLISDLFTKFKYNFSNISNGFSKNDKGLLHYR